MFVDHAVIHCLAGPGGNGCNSFFKSKFNKYKKANGGDGGNGGSIILKAAPQIRTLLDVKLTKTFKANQGRHGSGNDMTGAAAKNFMVKVPIGTEVFDNDTGDLLADLCEPGELVNIAKGGLGGKGNHRLVEATQGALGIEKNIRLELKIIADVGLVGFPNAGKSTLISCISNAKSRIAAFPFTTKQPILGVLESGYGESVVIADLPGLIEGASAGRGLGHRFLRHIERTKTLIHLVDMASTEGRDPVEDHRIILDELKSYSPVLAEKPIFIVATKMDIPESEEILKKFKEKVKAEIYPISAVTGLGVRELKRAIFKRHMNELGLDEELDDE
ncbi:MAG: GTP-binding protein [Candidatus Omnitrophota bacterium]|jgi:GTP-binding protein